MMESSALKWKSLHDTLVRESPMVLLRTVFHPSFWIPELKDLHDIEENKEHHPEGNTGNHLRLVVLRVFELTTDPKVRLAALLHDAGKAITGGKIPHPETGEMLLPKDGKHHDHDRLGALQIQRIFQDENWPEEYRGLCEDVAALHIRCHMLVQQQKPANIKVWIRFHDDLVDRWKARGIPESQWKKELESFLTACQADAQGRLDRHATPYPQKQWMLALHDALRAFRSPENEENRRCIKTERLALRHVGYENHPDKGMVPDSTIHAAISEKLALEYPHLRDIPFSFAFPPLETSSTQEIDELGIQ